MCDASNPEAVALLRARKRREGKAFAVMMADMEAVRAYCEAGEAEEGILTATQRPIVLLRKRPDAVFAPGLADALPELGVMLPYTPLHHLLLEAFAALSPLPALVMTSGNAGGEPISLGNREALARLRHIADLFLFHNRDILIRADDSVVRVESSPGECFSTDNNPQYYPQKTASLCQFPSRQTELLRGFPPRQPKP